MRRLSASELEEHHKRKACLKQDANDRWGRWTENQRARTLEARPVACPPANVNNGTGNIHRQLFGETFEYARPKPRQSPCPLDLTSEHLWQQRSLGPRREQRGYFEFENADQKRRVARMGLGGQRTHWEGAMPQTTRPPRTPEPTNHLLPRSHPPKERLVRRKHEQLEAQEQQSETSAFRQQGWKRTNTALLKAGAGQEEGQWKAAQNSLENQIFARQRREQPKGEHQTLEPQKLQLPTAKPGNLYPGPTRISEITPPIRFGHADSREDSIKSELPLSMHLKSKMACQEAYCKHEEKERKKMEGDTKATLCISRHEVTRTEYVKRLLASVNKALELNIEASEVEAAKTNIAEGKTSGDQSPEPSKGPENPFEAGPKCGESFWHRYDRSHPMFRQSDDCRVGLKTLALGTGPSQVSLDPSQLSDLHAAVEAIDRTSGDLLESPKAISDQHESPLLQSSTVSISQNREESAVSVSGLSRAPHKHPSVKTPNQSMSPPPTPRAEQTDLSSNPRQDKEGGREATGAAQWDVNIELEWEEVDGGLGDDEWIDVEQDFEHIVGTGNLSSSDVEWASDAGSEGAFEF